MNHIVDHEGRKWQRAEQLSPLRRDGLENATQAVTIEMEGPDGKKYNIQRPWKATMGKHTMMLRDPERGESENDKKGRFVSDEERWLHRYDALCVFREHYGHTNVPFRTRRSSYDSTVEKPTLSMNDTFRDDEDEHQGSGDRNYEYYASQEEIMDPKKSTIYMTDEFMEPYAGYELGFWVAQQRAFYWKHNGTKMTPLRVDLLNQLNFEWGRKESRWDTQYDLLVEFFNENGHTHVRQNSTLGHWVYKQRWHNLQIKRNSTIDFGKLLGVDANGKAPNKSDIMKDVHDIGGGREYRGKLISPLTPERRAKLDDINFVWSHDESIWEKNFQELIAYKELHNTTRVPSTQPTLGKWVRKHRAEWRTFHTGAPPPSKTDVPESKEYTFLLPARVRRLDSIGFEWVVRAYSWEDHYDHLLKYKRIHGHVNVPQKFNEPEMPKLGSWLMAQRRLQKAGKLEQNRCARLSKTGVVWDAVLEKFRLQVQELRTYSLTYGDMKVKKTADHKTLYSWLLNTKKEYRKLLNGEPSKIDPKRQEMLDELDFVERIMN